MNNNIIDIVAVGPLACQLCCTVQAVKRAARELKIPVAFRINGVDHYSNESVEAISDKVRELQQKP